MSLAGRVLGLGGERAAAAKTPQQRNAPSGSTQNVGWSAPGTPMTAMWDASIAVSVGYYGYLYSYRCARTIATTIAGLPFRAGADPDTPTSFDINSPLARLLGPPPGQPATQVSSRQLLIHSIVSYLVTGKFAWETPTAPRSTVPVSLWPLIAANFKPIPSKGGTQWFSGYEYDVNAKIINYGLNDVFYAWRPKQDDWRQPESVLQAAALPLQLGVALDQFMVNFMRNSMVSPTMIVTPEWDDQQMRRAFQDQFIAEMTGYTNAGRTSFAEFTDDGTGTSGSAGPPSVQAIQLGTKPVDAEVSVLQKWVRDTICDAYGVPVSIVGQASERTYANSDQEHKNFWTGTILGLLEELLDQINMGLAPRFGNDVGWFDLSGVEALQPPARFSEQMPDVLVAAGIVAVSEVREDLGLPPELPAGAAATPPEPIPAIEDTPSTTGGSSTGANPSARDAMPDLPDGESEAIWEALTELMGGERMFNRNEPRDPLTGEWISLGADVVHDLEGGSGEKHLVTDTHGTHFSEERQALHSSIIKTILAGHSPQARPEFHVLGGGPAAGKSSMLSKLNLPADSAVVNVDNIRELLPEYRKGDEKSSVFTHEESSYIAKQAQKVALARNINVTLDGTGDGSITNLQKKIAQARKAGYSVHGHYVSIDTDEAVRRADARALGPEGRHVPHDVIRTTHRGVSQVFEAAVDPQNGRKSFDTAELYDNNGAGGPVLIASKPMNGGLTVHDRAAFKRFTAKANEPSIEKATWKGVTGWKVGGTDKGGHEGYQWTQSEDEAKELYKELTEGGKPWRRIRGEADAPPSTVVTGSQFAHRG